MVYVINELYRFRMLVIGVFLGVAISSTYSFSIYTENLKAKYNLTQSQITTISAIGTCVGYMSFFSGMLFDYAGPKVVLLVAGVAGFTGSLVFGLAFDDVIPSLGPAGDVAQFSVYFSILAMACASLDGATLMPLVLTFPLDRGYMIIIQKTFAGLGTSVLMAYFNGFFRDIENKEKSNYAGFSYFVGSQMLVCALLGVFFIDSPPYTMSQYTKNRVSDEEKAERELSFKYFNTQHAPRRRLHIGCALIFVTLVFLTTISITTGYVSTSHTAYLILALCVIGILSMFCILALPLQILGDYTPVVAHKSFQSLGIPKGILHQDCLTKVTKHGPDEVPTGSVADNLSDLQVSGSQETSDHNMLVDPQYTGSFWSHLITLDLWLLWLTFFTLWGNGLVIQMNAAQIYRSKNYGVVDDSQLTLFIALQGVGSAIGRIISGVIDMNLTQWRREGRTQLLTTVFLPSGALFALVANLLFSLLPSNWLILSFFLSSMGHGLGWGLGVIVIRMVYADDIGKHYNFMYSAGSACTILMNRFMFGEIYDNRAREQHTLPHCNQPSCVRDQMFILAAVNLLSFLAAITVHFRFARMVRRCT